MRALLRFLTVIVVAAACTSDDRFDVEDSDPGAANDAPAASGANGPPSQDPPSAANPGGGAQVAADGSATATPAATGPAASGASTAPGASGASATLAGSVAAPATSPAAAEAAPQGDSLPAFVFPRPEHVRGIYVNAWGAGSRRKMARLTDMARRTELNAFVVDIKDATGYVSHPTSVPLAREIGATGEIRVPSLRVLLSRLQEAGVYPIARIVIVKDPLLAAARPDLAVQDTAGGPWVDDKGIVWLNPHHREVWDYHIAIAREVAEMGFPEVQWDYVRFPDAPASAMRRASFPGSHGRSRAEAIRGFLAYSREELSDLDVQVTADVFGVTTSAAGDVGIGQVWESFIDVVDVALPMVYPSHYWRGSFGYDEPNAHPYEIVREALERALARSADVEGAGTTRPWLQDFTLGPPRYEAPEVRAQIQAAYDIGINEWILWNPGSNYTEEALEPAEGFAEEPLIRIGGDVVALSRRFELFDTVTVVAEPETSAEEAGAAPDTTPALPDSGVTLPDTSAAPVPDTASALPTPLLRDRSIG